MSNRGSNPHAGRTRADDTVALGLAQGLPLATVAEQSGVSVRTISRRLADPVFRQRVSQLRRDALAAAAGQLSAAAVEATARLRQLVQSTDGKIALGAARAVLEFAKSLGETVDLAAEVEELRRLVEGADDGDVDRENQDAADAPPEKEAPPADSESLGTGPAEPESDPGAVLRWPSA